MQLRFGIPVMKLGQKKSGESAEDSSQVDLQYAASFVCRGASAKLRRRKPNVGRTRVAIPGGTQGEVMAP